MCVDEQVWGRLQTKGGKLLHGSLSPVTEVLRTNLYLRQTVAKGGFPQKIGILYNNVAYL